MTTEIAVRQSYMPEENEFNRLQIVARTAAASGLYGGVGNEQKIFMVLLAARELGVPAMQALNGGIWNIQGKIEISARLMSAMIRRAGHSMTVKECNAKICIIEGKRVDNGDTFTAQFSMDDAAKAGLANRGPWKTYAEDMLYARAMSRMARRLFPDVIGTAYVEGEIRDAKCEVVQAEAEVETKQESEELASLLVVEFAKSFSDENPDMIGKYLLKYAEHYKKTIGESISDYAENEKFLRDFGKWKTKNPE